MSSSAQFFFNSSEITDSGRLKADLRKILEKMADLLQPELLWPGYELAAHPSKSAATTAWINQWLDPLSFQFEQNKLHISFPNFFFGSVFHHYAASFLETALHMTYPEMMLQYTQSHNYIDIDFKFKSFIPNQTNDNENLDSFLINTKNEYSIHTLKKFCLGELSAKQILLRGKTGSGKTHLLMAIAEKFHQGQNEKSYYDIQDLLELFKFAQKKMFFRQNVLKSGFLALDNIHLLDEDLAAQKLLVQILDDFQRNNLPIIMSAAILQLGEDPLYKLIPELKARISQGMVLILHDPDLDIRLRYARQLFAQKNIPHGEEYTLFLARKSSGLRQLQGVSEQVRLFLTHTGQLPDEYDLGIMLRSSGSVQNLNPETIVAVVASHYGYNPRDLRGKKRTHDLVQARQIAMFLCREILGESYPRLGKIFGNKDHSTVMYAVKKISKMQVENKTINTLLNQLTSTCEKYEN